MEEKNLIHIGAARVFFPAYFFLQFLKVLPDHFGCIARDEYGACALLRESAYSALQERENRHFYPFKKIHGFVRFPQSNSALEDGDLFECDEDARVFEVLRHAERPKPFILPQSLCEHGERIFISEFVRFLLEPREQSFVSANYRTLSPFVDEEPADGF